MEEIQKVTRKKKEVSSASSITQKRFPWGIAILSVLLVAALGAAGYFYYELKWAKKVETGEEIKDLTATIGEFIELPTDETPTLATVTDREKLADQTFFLKAENGDKVLIYSNNGKAILYRPSTKKVIDITTVNVAKTENENSAPKVAPEAPESPATEDKPTTVTLYNGSTKNAVTGPIEEKVQNEFSFVTAISKETAKKRDYQETIVINQSGSHEVEAKKLADFLGAQIVTLPDGEVAPATDVVVIIGNNGEEGN